MIESIMVIMNKPRCVNANTKQTQTQTQQTLGVGVHDKTSNKEQIIKQMM